MDYLTLHPPRLYALPFFRSLLKFFDQGVPNDTVHTIIEVNVRDPQMVLGDFYGLVSACRTGEQGAT